MEPCRHQQLKRHARLRYDRRSTSLWVGNPDDWELVRHEPRPALVCPEPSCEVELISYENPNNRYNPRIFKFKPGERSCDHWSIRGRGGGPESAQHEWMKLRLTRIAGKLGYTATPEYVPMNADVFVHAPSFCLEVQLRPTQFRKRTAAREAKGAKVCWLIRDGLDSEKVRKALFGLPAVRFRVVDRDNPGRLLMPWDDPADRDLAQRARLEVFATVAHAPQAEERPDPAVPGTTWFQTHTMDGLQFLEEILSGRRRWYRPGMLGHKRGLWALKTDVDEYFAFVAQVRKAAEQTLRLGEETPVKSPPGPGSDPSAPELAGQPSPGRSITLDVPATAEEDPPSEPVPPAVRHVGPPPEQPIPSIDIAVNAPVELRGWWQRLWPFRRR